MNKLLEPPPAIVETVVRYECPKCGNSCSCGVPYAAKTMRAAEYAAQNPAASVREIAKQTGVSLGTAYNAKSGVQTEHLTTGLDGKEYPAAKPRKPPRHFAGHDLDETDLAELGIGVLRRGSAGMAVN
jgi:hypothetical protein